MLKIKTLKPRPHLVSLAWPLMAELVLGFLVGLLGLWLASRVSDTASAAFALSNHVLSAFFILFRVISMGVSVVITQNLGANNRVQADQIAHASIGASTWVGLFTAALILISAGPVLSLLQTPDAIHEVAKPYLQTLALALFLDAYNASMASVMRAHLHTRDTMMTVLLMHTVHLVLCVPMMNGFGPMPALGLPGFALAMAISRAVGVCAHLVLWQWRLRLHPVLEDWWKLKGRLLMPALLIGIPGAAENIAYRIAMLASLSVVAGFGAKQMATHSYASQIMNLIVLFTVALGFAGEILVGHLVGAKQFKQANRVLRKSLFWGLGISFCIALFAAITAPITLRLFTHDESIIKTATTLLWLTVLLEPGRTCNVIIINALRATGDARFPVMVGAGSMLLVMAGGSWLLGSYFGLGLVGVWIAYAADEWLRGMMMAARWFKRGWVKHARTSLRRT